MDIKASLSLEQQAIYYSSWHYAAIHIMTTIKAMQTREALHQYLQIPTDRLNEVINFFVVCTITDSRKGPIDPGVSRIFLGTESAFLNKHHTNWRVRAIESLDRSQASDVHFSGVVSLAKEDVLKLKEKIVNRSAIHSEKELKFQNPKKRSMFFAWIFLNCKLSLKEA